MKDGRTDKCTGLKQKMTLQQLLGSNIICRGNGRSP